MVRRGLLTQPPAEAPAGAGERVTPQLMRATVACPECRQPLTLEAQVESVCAHCQMLIPGALAAKLVERAHETEATPGDPRKRPAPKGPEHEALPRRIKHYELLEEIGRGGMGVVYKARQVDLDREVALKLIRTALPTEGEGLRFVAEAQVTGQLEHPNIVPIHEIGADERGRPYFVMKLVRGRALSDILMDLRKSEARTQREYPLSRLLRIFCEICQAVAFAHARGVLHRDLKPSNVMIGDFGEVQVMDWGLAKLLHAPATKTAGLLSFAPDTPPKRVRSTADGVKTVRDRELESAAGMVAGTPEYMAPEQAAGETSALSPRSDVYSLGVILFEILNYRPPHLEADTRTLMRKIATEPVTWPKPGGARPKVGAPLKAVVMKALALDPAERYPSALALLQDVRAVLDDKPVSARRDTLLDRAARIVRRHGALIATAAAAAVTISLGAATALWWMQALATERAVEAEAREAAVQRLRAEESKALEAERKRGEAEAAKVQAERDKLLAEARTVEEARLLAQTYPQLTDAEELLARNLPAVALEKLKYALGNLPPHSPVVARAYYLSGEAHRMLGSNEDAKEAIIAFETADKLAPRGDPRALLNCGDIAWRLLYDTGLARDYYQKAADVDPRNAYSLLGRALAAVLTGRRLAEDAAPDDARKETAKQALASAQRAIQLADFLWEAHWIAGTIYAGLEFPGCGLEDPERAHHHFTQALRHNGNLTEVWYDRARLARSRGQPKEAAADLTQVLRLDPEHAKALGLNAELAVELGQPREALKDLDRAQKQDPENARLRLVRGRAMLALNDWASASDAFGEALRLDPKLSEAWLLRARAHAALDKHAEAAEDAAQACALDPQALEALTLRAESRLRAGQHAAAVEDFRALQQRAPAYVEAWRGLADALRAAGQMQQAIDAYAAYLDKKPDRQDIRLLLVRLLSADPAAAWFDPAKAVAAARKAQELAAGQDPQITIALADALLAAGQTKAALETIESAYTHFRQNPDVLAAHERIQREAKKTKP
ncbi:MAG: hypothetical protein AMXMBFR7_00730 [Planctomycetota bacterium]